MTRVKEFVLFIKFVVKSLTRILFKIKRQKEFNEKEIMLMKRLHFLYTQYYEE